MFDLPSERWLWDCGPDCPTPEFIYDVPAALPREVATVVSISNCAVRPQGMEVVEFQARTPNRGIIRAEAHLNAFRRDFNAFLMALVRAGVRVLHIHPATPLCVSVEIGRMLLPKTFEEIHVHECKLPLGGWPYDSSSARTERHLGHLTTVCLVSIRCTMATL